MDNKDYKIIIVIVILIIIIIIIIIITGLELPNFGGTATLALTFVAKIGHQGKCQRHQGHTVIFRRTARQNPR